MKIKDLFILYIVSLLNNVIIYQVSSYLMLVDIDKLKLENHMFLLISFVYLVVSNLALLLGYNKFLINKGRLSLYFLLGSIDFIIYSLILFNLFKVDYHQGIVELIFVFLLFLGNSIFICYSIYYKNLLKYNSYKRTED